MPGAIEAYKMIATTDNLTAETIPTRGQKPLSAPILVAKAGAQAIAKQINQPCYVVRDPNTKQYDLIPADRYQSIATRRRIIEFIAFTDRNGD
jgi:hypothetical protein